MVEIPFVFPKYSSSMIGTMRLLFLARQRCKKVSFSPSKSERTAVAMFLKYGSLFWAIAQVSPKITKKNQCMELKQERLFRLRQCKREFTSLSHFTFYEYFATILFNKLLAEDKAKASSFFICRTAGGIGCGFVEQYLQHVVVHAHTVVFYRDQQLGFLVGCRNNDFSAIVCKLDGVRHKVPEYQVDGV